MVAQMSCLKSYCNVFFVSSAAISVIVQGVLPIK